MKHLQIMQHMYRIIIVKSIWVIVPKFEIIKNLNWT